MYFWHFFGETNCICHYLNNGGTDIETSCDGTSDGRLLWFWRAGFLGLASMTRNNINHHFSSTFHIQWFVHCSETAFHMAKPCKFDKPLWKTTLRQQLADVLLQFCSALAKVRIHEAHVQNVHKHACKKKQWHLVPVRSKFKSCHFVLFLQMLRRLFVLASQLAKPANGGLQPPAGSHQGAGWEIKFQSKCVVLVPTRLLIMFHLLCKHNDVFAAMSMWMLVRNIIANHPLNKSKQGLAGLMKHNK